MDKFQIDRAQGVAIWIDVKKGKVKKCYNGGEKFDARMNELYKGKSITFLKQDFEYRMQGVYCNVRPESILIPTRIVFAIKQRIADCKTKISRIYRTNYTQDDAKANAEQEIRILKLRLVDLEEDLIKANKRLETEIERIASEHDFDVMKKRELV